MAGSDHCAIDVLYGHREAVAKGKIYMAHKTGFTYSTLYNAFFKAGFKFNVGSARPNTLIYGSSRSSRPCRTRRA